jgi:nicotinic acid mononucleotide adenylyltransferase
MLDTALPQLRDRIDWLDQAAIDISAGDIRQRLIHNQPIDQLVPADVIDYVHAQQLYV